MSESYQFTNNDIQKYFEDNHKILYTLDEIKAALISLKIGNNGEFKYSEKGFHYVKYEILEELRKTVCSIINNI
jgi:hypothetical protein